MHYMFGSSPLSRSLWWVFLLNGVLVGALGYVFFQDSFTTLANAYGFLRGHAGMDSWKPMFKAIEHLRSTSGVPLYEQIFFNDQVKFQYPLSSLLPLDYIQRVTGISNSGLMKIINWGCWSAVIAVAVTSWRLLVELYGPSPVDRPAADSRWAKWDVFIPAMGIALTFYPLMMSFRLGQIQTLITLLVALSFLAWHWNHRVTAGVLMGLCALIKPQWGLIIVWAALRKEWRFAAACAVMVASVTLLTTIVYGFGNQIDYLHVLSFMGKHGEGYYPNQSLNGLLNRLFFNGNNLVWEGHEFAPYDARVYWPTFLSALFILGAALVWRRNEQPTVYDFALMTLSLTMASPIAWEHHYGILLPIFAIIAPVALKRGVMGRYTAAYIVVAFFLSSHFLKFTNSLAATHLNFLQSYLFFAAVMVMVLLYRLSSGERLDVVDDVSSTTPESSI